jgi:3-dehydroquinate dehydratase type I
MSALKGLKTPAVVGVIRSRQELQLARRMRMLPDLFELRLDYLPRLAPAAVPNLRRPVIITARHPAEGGSKSLNQPGFCITREELLLNFLPHAAALDLELRSLRELGRVWEEAAKYKRLRICSVHDFKGRPRRAVLHRQLERAQDAGADVFKLVAAADTPEDLLVLLTFLHKNRRSSAVMATGRLGRISRLLFLQFGSRLVYTPLLRPFHSGQLTFHELQQMHRSLGENPAGGAKA